jgi:hypothetical protein
MVMDFASGKDVLSNPAHKRLLTDIMDSQSDLFTKLSKSAVSKNYFNLSLVAAVLLSIQAVFFNNKTMTSAKILQTPAFSAGRRIFI